MNKARHPNARRTPHEQVALDVTDEISASQLVSSSSLSRRIGVSWSVRVSVCSQALMDHVSSTDLSQDGGVFGSSHSMSHPSHPRICVGDHLLLHHHDRSNDHEHPIVSFLQRLINYKMAHFFLQKKADISDPSRDLSALVANGRCFRHFVALCSSGVRTFLETSMGAACFARMRFRIDDRHAHPVILRNTTRPISR